MGLSVLMNVVYMVILCSTCVVGHKLQDEQSHSGQGQQRLRRTTRSELAGNVTKLRLINADTDQPIAGYDPLPANARIDLRTLPTPNLSVEAITSQGGGVVASVQWKFDGISRVENFPRWAMCYNNGPDIYACQRLVAGFNSTITATPFTDDNAKGARGASVSIQLSLFRSNVAAPTTSKAPQAPPTLAPSKATTDAPLNPTTNAPVATIEAPVAAPTKAPVLAPLAAPIALSTKSPTAEPKTAMINLTLVDFAWDGVNVSLVGNDTIVEFDPSSPLTIRADVEPSLGVQSVQFTYDGQVVRTENEAPYTLAGRQGTVLSPWLPTPGSHILSVKAFSQKNATGSILAYSTVAFTAKLQKDTNAPLLLTLIAPERANTLSPPKTLELSLMARDDASGIARATVFLSTYVGFQNYIDHSNVTVQFDSTTVSSTKGKRFFFNVSLPYPKALPAGFYLYRVEVEDGSGNLKDGANTGSPFGEFVNIQSSLYVYERRVELLNVNTAPKRNPTVTVNSSGLVTDVPVQITLKDDQGSVVCISASGNGFSTEDGFESIQFPGSFQFTPNCKSFPTNRVAGQPIVMNLTLGMRSYFPTGSYFLKVFTFDYSYDSAYLTSNNFSSIINLVNPNVRADWKPPKVTSLVALSSPSVNLAVSSGTPVNVTTRLVLQDDVSGFNGEIQFLLNKRIAARVSAMNMSFVAGQPMQFDVSLPIFDRPGTYPLSLVLKDKFKNIASVSSASLAQQGQSVVVDVKGVLSPPLSTLESLYLQDDGFGKYDVSFGYRRVVLSYDFGSDRAFFKSGSMNLTATGASTSNLGVVLQGGDGCHPRYGSNYPFYYCFFLDETTPLGLYLLSADVDRGLVYDSAALADKRFSSNFTVTYFLKTGLGL